MLVNRFGKHGKVSAIKMCTDTHVPNGLESATKCQICTLELALKE